MKGFILAGAVAALAFATPAKAADLGGNCCADLEERVAELEATVARKGNRKVSLTVYGQVNAGILWADADASGHAYAYAEDGGKVLLDWKSDTVRASGSDKRIFDNNVSESRFGFKGEATISKDVKAGFVMEIGVGEKVDDGDVARNVSVRHAAWFIQSAQLGRLTVGKTGQATDDIDTIMIANVGAAVKMLSVEPVAGQYIGTDLPFDGGKRNVARYDSPSIAGFVVSASWGDEDAWDVALRYAGELGQFKVAGGAGYREQNGSFLGADEKQTGWLANAGIMHTPSGIFVQAAYGDIDTGQSSWGGVAPVGTPPSYDIGAKGWHLLGGIEWKAISAGKTTLFGEYADLDADRNRTYDCFGGDAACGTRESLGLKWWGVGVVQAIDAAAMISSALTA